MARVRRNRPSRTEGRDAGSRDCRLAQFPERGTGSTERVQLLRYWRSAAASVRKDTVTIGGLPALLGGEGRRGRGQSGPAEDRGGPVGGRPGAKQVGDAILPTE